MESHKRQRLEEQLRRLCESHEYGHAVTLALRGYGQELRKLMRVTLGNPAWVDDAFGIFSESLLKSLPEFRWESSFRTWALRVARFTCARYLHSRGDREQWVSEGALTDHPQHERSVTQPWLQSAVKQRFRALREQLSPHEQRIFALRIDRGLPWNDVARELAGRDLSTKEMQQRVAVLRQQFRRIKARLSELAQDDSLLHPESL